MTKLPPTVLQPQARDGKPSTEAAARSTNHPIAAIATSHGHLLRQGCLPWLTVLPMTSHGFSLPKAAFRDALCMRQPDHLPSHCSCGQAFSVDHALSCVSGGYFVMRHKELRDFTASVLQEVCKDVELEPPLQPLSGEQLRRSANATQEARLRGVAG